MNQQDSELSRQARLIEQREQRRAVLTTTAVAIAASLLIGGFAFARLQSNDKTTVVVGGVSNVSSTSSRRFVVPKTSTTAFQEPTTTTIKRIATTTASTATTAPAPTTTSSTLPAIPANIGDLFTTTAATTAPPVTTTTIAVAPNIVWSASPNPLRLQAGAQAAFTVTARNAGNGPGQVGCPPLPNGIQCTQQQFTLAPGETKSWTGTVWATTGGSRLGNPLPAGTHQIFVGVAVLVLQVTP